MPRREVISDKIVTRRGFLAVQPDSEYPKYFGYHPKFRGISEPVQ